MAFDGIALYWRRFVQDKLELSQADPSEAEEVVAELASHLEDAYEQHRDAGLTESRAIAEAPREVTDWRELSRKIRCMREKENEMNQRTKAVWIPGLISFTVASGVLAMLQVWHVQPHIVWVRSGLALLFYVPWLIAQPAFGAAGAYVSRRLGGTRNERLVAGIFPSIAMLLTFFVVLAIVEVLRIFGIGDHVPSINIIRFLELYGSMWVVVPGLALGLGALPFLRDAGAQEAH